MHHAVNLALRQAALLVCDRDVARLAGALVLRGHVQYAVRVDIEGDLDLRDAAGCGRNAVEMELAQQVVVPRHGALPLIDLDEHSRLIVSIRGEGLGLLGGDGRVPVYELRHHPARRFKAHGQGRHVQQQEVLHLRRARAGQDRGLDRGAEGHGLVGVDGLAQLLPVEELLDHRLDPRDPRRTAHQHHLVDLPLVDAAVAQALLHGAHRVSEVVHVELLEASARQGAAVVDALEQRVDLDRCLRGGRQGPLGPLALRPQAPDRAQVRGHVLAAVPALEVLHAVVDDAVVKVLAA
mmetsp:Transcript_24628/g.67654  ORF Transcript_24628/g.67654 Transcript_24628/m.67654 type:complete len:294 (-) Transcript_24628:728-1609(-)